MKKFLAVLAAGVLLSVALVSPCLAAAADPLQPADINIKGVGTIGKTAVRTAADEWQVTMTLSTSSRIAPEPVELVILLDTSGSMAWCTQNTHTHSEDCYELACTAHSGRHKFDTGKAADGEIDNSNCYTLVCELPEHSHAAGGSACAGVAEEDSRQYIAGSAARQLVSSLAGSGVPAEIGVVTFSGTPRYNHSGGISEYNDTTSLRCALTDISGSGAKTVTDCIPTGGAVGATCLADGLNAAHALFTDADNAKFLVILSDGDYDGSDPTPAAQSVKDDDITIYSVGFMYGSNTMRNIASPDSYSTAGTGTVLGNIFELIYKKISAMVVDPAGENLDIVTGSVSVTGKDGTATVIDNTLYWTPNSPIASDTTVTIRYTLKLHSVELGDNNGIFNNCPLNDGAKLVYSKADSHKSRCAYFPVPLAHYEVGMMSVTYTGLPATIAPAPQNQTLIVDFKPVDFSFAAPRASYEDAGVDYCYVGSTYTPFGENPQQLELLEPDPNIFDGVSGVSTLVHKYTLECPTTTYTVKHYKELPAGGFAVAQTDTLPATVGEFVEGSPYVYPGYTYDPEYPDSVLSGNVLPDGALTLELYYTLNRYTLGYEDGVSDETITVPPTVSNLYGAQVIQLSTAVPVRSGYRFTGWKTGDDIYQPGADFTMPLADVTLTAQWQRSDAPVTGDNLATIIAGAVLCVCGALCTAALVTRRRKLK